MKTHEDFLKKLGIHTFQVDLADLVKSFTAEMLDGLTGKYSSLMMYPARIGIKDGAEHKGTVLAIDAGGTNFRAALVRFDGEGKPEIIEKPGIVKFTMPGIDCELSKNEFFEQIVEKLRIFDSQYEKIGFCFSYPTEMQRSAKRGDCQIVDGKLEKWTKGIKAPEVVGEMIGDSILTYLGVTNIGLVVLNDTVATLMAGKGEKKGYGSYIGFILGTGTNTCYIEKNSNIQKESSLKPEECQIINIESGNFNKIILSDVDKELDRSLNKKLGKDSKDLGSQIFEKMISGRYLGDMFELVIKKAAAEGDYFSDETNKRIVAKDNPFELDKTETVNYFISKESPLSYLFLTENDKKVASGLINGVLRRAAAFVAANLAAVILKTGKGKTSDDKVLIVVDGSTFFKFGGYKQLINDNLQRCFKEIGENRFYEIISDEIADINLKGAAIAAAENV